MKTEPSSQYDVIILGGDFAALCQARHLKLNIPQIKIAVVDPGYPNQPKKEESLREIAALFLTKELGLFEYLVEKQVPKIGLNYHWPKQIDSTNTLEDYYHIWSNRQVDIPAFSIKINTFEEHLRQLNQQSGITFYQGEILNFSEKEMIILSNNHKHQLNAQYLINTLDETLESSSKSFNRGVAYCRVKNVDRTLFDLGYHPTEASTSHYYGTNYYFGHGYCCWMIPTDTNTMELSIGSSHYPQQLPASEIQSFETFLDFIKDNQMLLYKLIKSGEVIDFSYHSQMSDIPQISFSPEVYRIGNLNQNLDHFHTYDSSILAVSIESVTKLIQDQLNNESEPRRYSLYSQLNQMIANASSFLQQADQQQLGHASIMSWRIYFQQMWWFGLYIPMYLGKWHLEPKFIPFFLKTHQIIDKLFANLSEQFNQLVIENRNLGLIDCYRADQLLGGYYTSKHFDHFLENTKLEPRFCNVFTGIKQTFLYTLLWYIKFQIHGFGLLNLLTGKSIFWVLTLVIFYLRATFYDWMYRWQSKQLPENTEIEQMRQEFKKYNYTPQLQPWLNLSTHSPEPEKLELSTLR